jgi:hypothetical protein
VCGAKKKIPYSIQGVKTMVQITATEGIIILSIGFAFFISSGG